MNRWIQRGEDQVLWLVQTVDWPCTAIQAVSHGRSGKVIAEHNVVLGVVRPVVPSASYGYGETVANHLVLGNDGKQTANDFGRLDRVQIGSAGYPEQMVTERAIVASYAYHPLATQLLTLLGSLRNSYPKAPDGVSPMWSVWNCRYGVSFSGADFQDLGRNYRLDVVFSGAGDRTARDVVMFDVVARVPRLVATAADLQARWNWLFNALQRQAEHSGATLEERIADGWARVLRDVSRKVHPATVREQSAFVEPTLLAVRLIAAENEIRPLGQDLTAHIERCSIEYHQAMAALVASLSYVDADDNLVVDAGEENVSRRSMLVYN
jgi:hypothetical protein